MKKTLLVLIPDRLSLLIEKGEITPRYYNPGNFFDEVHIMMTNDDQPDPRVVQTMVGKAKLFLHNYPEPAGFFKKTLGWRPWLMKKWAKGAVDIIQETNPSLIRCHGAHLNSFLAAEAKKALGIPYVVSLHINPDENFRKYAESFKCKIIHYALKTIEKIGLRTASHVTPVYEPIVPYLKQMGIKHYSVCYNVLSDNITEKKSYALSSPVKIVSIGRLIEDKNPINIIEAIQDIPNVHFTIVGTGPIKSSLEQIVSQKKMEAKVAFVDSIENEDLCKTLHQYDVVALHSEYYEFSKVMIESSLAGLPLLVNYRKDPKQVPELGHNNCFYVENSYHGYFDGLNDLIANPTLRKTLGSSARKFAQERCSPPLCEDKYVSIYKSLLNN